MILTAEIIKQGRSKRGGWSKLQFMCLGVSRKEMKVKGWKDKVVGTDIPENKIKAFLSLKDQHFSKKKYRKNCDHSFEFVADGLISCIYCNNTYPIDERSELKL